MNGSRLLITAEDPKLARRWVDELKARGRQRKLFDRYPGTLILTHPWGAPHDPVPHVDRLYERHMLSLGSMFTYVGYAPMAELEDRKRELDDALDEWEARMIRAADVAKHVGGWGDPWCRILFVGDRYNGDRAAQLPFSNKNGASRTLSLLLDAARIPESACYFVNAYTKAGRPLLMKEHWAALRPREVVALGREAHARVVEIGIDSFVQFPHPQYLGRFEGARLAAWGAKLRGYVEHAL